MNGFRQAHTLSSVAGTAGLIHDGDWVESKDQNQAGDVRLIQLADIGVGEYLNKSNRRMTLDAALRLRCTFLKPGDILVARMPDPIGRACIFPGDASPCVTVVDICILRVDRDIADANYVLQQVNSPSFSEQISRFVKGTTRQRISRTSLEALRMDLPSLDEQRRIAAILDQADDLRRKRRLALKGLEALPHAIFQDMFGDPVTNPKGWPRATLRDLIDIQGGWSPLCLDRSASIKEWGVLKLSAVSSCVYDDSENKALPASTQPRTALEVIRGDVLFSRKNTYQLVGASAFVTATRPKLTYPDLIFRLRPRQNSNAITGRYLHALLIAPNKRRQIQALAGGVAGSMPNISMGRLSEIEIEIPPMAWQLQFARILEDIESSRQSSLAHDATLNSLFASLQDRSFSNAPFRSHSDTAVIV